MAPTTVSTSTPAATLADMPTFRPILPSDGPALVRFHEALSADAQRSRFFAVHPHLTATEVDRFSHVDHLDREAIIVTVGTEIIAVGRYDRIQPSNCAEVAFVTAEGHRGDGLATQLLARLAAAAQAVGIVEFVAQTLPENRRMLGVFTRSPFTTVTRFSGGVIEVSMLLTPTIGTDGTVRS
ncbi:MAG: GNAT family N-acetyltransferase [Acidimicrobiales bacterium]